jgi:hypothetical protein
MSRFHFPLQKALELRRKQLEIEEAHYKQQLAAVADLDRRRHETRASGAGAEADVRRRNAVTGWDLDSLGRFRVRIRNEEARIAGDREAAAQKAAEQQESMLEARRRCRLLERLRERRLKDWEAARDREVEELANDSFLAQWNRRTDPTVH